jgi:hypothetical protein
MCQQHLRNFSCGHSEYLKPRYCPTSMINGGAPCEPVDVVPRNADHKCPACFEADALQEAANASIQPQMLQQTEQQSTAGASETMDTSQIVPPGQAMHANQAMQAMHPGQAGDVVADAGDAMDTSEG